MTLKQAIHHARGSLAAKNIEDALLESELLLRHALKISQTQLYIDFDRELSPKQEKTFWNLVKRRLKGEPTAYIIGHVLLEIEPLPRGSGDEFAARVVGGSVPKNYIPAVEKGVNEAVHEGILARYPVVDIKTTLYDGSFHPVDSSEICFKIAGAQALKKGLAQGQPILLEPIMNTEVRVPEEFTGDIIGGLNTKRAKVLGMNPEHGANVIEAQVPLAEILRYAIDLRSITQGRGSYTVDFSHYEEVPANVAQKVIAERQAEKD